MVGVAIVFSQDEEVALCDGVCHAVGLVLAFDLFLSAIDRSAIRVTMFMASLAGDEDHP